MCSIVFDFENALQKYYLICELNICPQSKSVQGLESTEKFKFYIMHFSDRKPVVILGGDKGGSLQLKEHNIAVLSLGRKYNALRWRRV